MLLYFTCPKGHLTKKLSDKELHTVDCSFCSMVAIRSYDKSSAESEIITKIDTGFQNKVVNYSEKQIELNKEQSDKHSKFLLGRLGRNTED